MNYQTLCGKVANFGMMYRAGKARPVVLKMMFPFLSTDGVMHILEWYTRREASELTTDRSWTSRDMQTALQIHQRIYNQNTNPIIRAWEYLNHETKDTADK